MRLFRGDMGGGGGGGGGKIFSLLLSFALVSLARAQLDILAQKVMIISKFTKRDFEIVLGIFNEDIPP